MNTQDILDDFGEKSKKLITHGGLSVLLDYPPYDMVLDPDWVKEYILSQLTIQEQQHKEEMKKIIAQLKDCEVSVEKNEKVDPMRSQWLRKGFAFAVEEVEDIINKKLKSL